MTENITSYAHEAARIYNDAVQAGGVLPRRVASKQAAYVERFVAILCAHGFKARAWWPANGGTPRVYVARDRYVLVSCDGLCLDREGRGIDRGKVYFLPTWLYRSERDRFLVAVREFYAWQVEILRETAEVFEAFCSAVDAEVADAADRDFAHYRFAKRVF